MTNTTTIIPSSRAELDAIINSAEGYRYSYAHPSGCVPESIMPSVELTSIMTSHNNAYDTFDVMFNTLVTKGASLKSILGAIFITGGWFSISNGGIRAWLDKKFDELSISGTHVDDGCDSRNLKDLYDLITHHNGGKESLHEIMALSKHLQNEFSNNIRKHLLSSGLTNDVVDALDGALILCAAGNSLGFELLTKFMDDIKDSSADDNSVKVEESVVDSVIVVPTTNDELEEAVRRIEVAFNTVGGFVSHLKSSYSTQDLKDIRKGLEWISEQYLALVKAGYHDEISEEISDIAVFASELLKLDKKYSSSKPKVFADTLIRLFRRFSIGDRKTVLKNIKEMINGKPKESTEKFEETPSAKKDVKKTESKKEDSNTKDYDPLPGADLYNRVVKLCKHVDLLATTIAFKPEDAYIVNAMLSTFVKSTNFNNKLKRKGYNGGKLVEVPMSKYQNKIPKSAKSWCTSIFEAPTDDANDPIVVFYQMKPEETEDGKHKSPRKLVIRSSKLENYVTG